MADSFKYGTKYNFSFVKTVAFEDEPELDPSGCDRLHNKYRITIQAVIAGVNSPGLDAIMPIGEKGESTADILARIREDVMRPRQQLLYAQNGKTIIEVDDPPDAANGPFPVSFRALLVSPGSLTVEFTVEVRIADCQLGKRRGWSSNRWESTDSYDKCGYCTTRTRGLLIARSDMRQATPDDFRGIAAPVLRNGFQSEDFEYTLSPDGLKLSYSFVDKEYYNHPPLGAMDWGGEFSTMTVNGISYGMATVYVKGAKGADKAALWRQANKIALARLLPLIPDDGKKIPITQMGFRENLNAAEVEVNFRIQLEPKKVAAAVGQLPGQGGKIEAFGAGLIGAPLPGLKDKDQPGVAPPIRGNHPLIRLIASIFHDPCYLDTEQSTGVSPGDAPSINQPRRELGNDAFIRVAQVSERKPPDGSQNRPGYDNYSKYKIRTNYLWDDNATVLVPTDADKKVSVVRLGPPVLNMRVEWVAESTGSRPVIPSPCPPPDVCDIYELLDEAVSVDSPAISPTGEMTYRMYGVYDYVVTDHSRVAMSAPLPPFLAPQLKSQDDVKYDSPGLWKFMSNRSGIFTGHWERCECDESGSPGLGGVLQNGEGGLPPVGGGIPIPGLPGTGEDKGIPPNWLPEKLPPGGILNPWPRDPFKQLPGWDNPPTPAQFPGG